jgi:hypothetical protein
VPDDECQHPGAHKYTRREDAEDGPLQKRRVLTGKDYEVKVCSCGYYHLVKVNENAEA